jgi:uncharacterized BrkB/YihY/UPF0761 family membrane protein
MTAINRAHERDDSRGFLERRLVAVARVASVGTVVLLLGVLLVLGPHLQRWIDDALDAEGAVAWIWWTAEWPVLIGGLFAAFAVVFALATDRRSTEQKSKPRPSAHRWPARLARSGGGGHPPSVRLPVARGELASC